MKRVETGTKISVFTSKLIKQRAFIFITGFALIGAAILLAVHAATPAATIERHCGGRRARNRNPDSADQDHTTANNGRTEKQLHRAQHR